MRLKTSLRKKRIANRVRLTNSLLVIPIAGNTAYDPGGRAKNANTCHLFDNPKKNVIEIVECLPASDNLHPNPHRIVE